jgi:hypothetical protein
VVEVKITARKGSGSVISGNAQLGIWFRWQALSQLFFKVSDQRGEPLFGEGVNRFSSQSAGLCQPLLQFFLIALCSHALPPSTHMTEKP